MTKAVDLFSGWGGFTTGAEEAGVDVVWAANHWPVAITTHALNHPGTLHVCQDLQQADWTTLPDYDILLAGPACQGHSTASQPKRRAYHDAMRQTATAIIDCADVTEPKAIVVENVPAFLRWRLYDWWCDGLTQLGYHLQPLKLTASHYGVPQRRERVFMVATRNAAELKLNPSSLEPAFEPHLEADPGNWHEVGAATPKTKERIERSRRRHGHRFLTQHTSDHYGVPLHEPIRTITTAQCHWNLVDGDRYRPLSGRELARGMGFPESFQWSDALSVKDVTRGIGNAVCPPVATSLLHALQEVI